MKSSKPHTAYATVVTHLLLTLPNLKCHKLILAYKVRAFILKSGVK